jgi:hypothetical protein
MPHLPRMLHQLLTRRLLFAVSLFVTVVAANGALASTLDRLQGAWGGVGIPCDAVFTKKGNETVFALRDGERSAGFIVNGKNIDGAQATCKLLSSKEEAAAFKFVLACRQEIMFGNMVVILRFVDEDNLVRFDPDFPDLQSAYHRCRM